MRHNHLRRIITSAWIIGAMMISTASVDTTAADEIEWSTPPLCSAPRSHDEADLCEQRRMAKAAETTVLINWFQLVASILGVAFVLWSLREARKSTDAAVRANELLAEDQRPWLQISFSYDGTTQSGPETLLRVRPTIRNVGSRPASAAMVWNVSGVSTDELRKQIAFHIANDAKQRDGLKNAYGNTIFPGDQLSPSTAHGIPTKNARQTNSYQFGGIVSYQGPSGRTYFTPYIFWLQIRLDENGTIIAKTEQDFLSTPPT